MSAELREAFGLEDVIPSDWEVVPFDDAVDFQEGPGILAKDFHENGIPLLRLSGLQRSIASLDGCNYLDPDKVSKKWNHFRLKIEDLLISTSASIGRVSEVDADTEGSIAYTGIIRLRPNRPDVLKGFIRYFASSSFFESQATSMATGSVIKHFGPTHLKKMWFPVPSVEEQEQISKILGDVDAKIELNRKQNETMEGLARAMFQSWFVDFDPVKAKLAAVRHGRDPEQAAVAALSGKLVIAPGNPRADMLDDQLPSADELDAAIAELDDLTASAAEALAKVAALFSGDFQESELGLIPSGWEAVALYDTAEFVNGAAFNADDFTDADGALPIIKIAELKQGITDQTKFTANKVKERHRIDSGDLLYSWSGSPGTSLEVFKWFGGPGWLNQHIFKINVEADVQKIFVWLLLKHLKPELIRIAENKQTTGLGHVTVADMNRLMTVRPDAACLAAFGELVGPIYEQHSNGVVQSNTLVELRDTLLPKLMSGELSVG